MAVKGATAAERQAARAKQTAARRVAFFAARIQAAGSPARQLSEACNYLLAAAAPLPDDVKQELTRMVVALADERNRS